MRISNKNMYYKRKIKVIFGVFFKNCTLDPVKSTSDYVVHLSHPYIDDPITKQKLWVFRLIINAKLAELGYIIEDIWRTEDSYDTVCQKISKNTYVQNKLHTKIKRAFRHKTNQIRGYFFNV